MLLQLLLEIIVKRRMNWLRHSAGNRGELQINCVKELLLLLLGYLDLLQYAIAIT
jgi:hypothetical protein